MASFVAIHRRRDPIRHMKCGKGETYSEFDTIFRVKNYSKKKKIGRIIAKFLVKCGKNEAIYSL